MSNKKDIDRIRAERRMKKKASASHKPPVAQKTHVNTKSKKSKQAAYEKARQRHERDKIVQKVDNRTYKQAVKRAKKSTKQRGVKRAKRSNPLLMMVTSVFAVVLIFGLVGTVIVGQYMDSASEEWATSGKDISHGDLPGVTQVLDSHGNNIANFYSQNRQEVKSEDISQYMKDAIVSVEDKRFFDHDGMDTRGVLRAAVNNVKGEGQQGASTLEMQLAKNYRYLIESTTDEEREKAIEATPERKLKDIQTAINMDKEMSKDEILTRYLNLVPFGNGAHGVQAAAQTYFGINAKELSPSQSALLAGLVQSPEYNNPFTYPDHALERRNTVLDTMSQLYPDKVAQAKKEPLGTLPEPKRISKGCTGANADIQAGFFCQYMVSWLENHGVTEDQIVNGGYTIKTTLDPLAQKSTLDAVRSTTDPHGDNVQTVASFIDPIESRPIRSMVSSRPYGIDENKQETTMLTPATQVGAGGGSTFKIFTAATRLQQGGSIKEQLDNPPSASLEGMGSSGGDCAGVGWCVQNLGSYPNPITMEDALAQSPNVAFAKLIQRVGVPATVNTSVALGLRDYAASQTEGQESIKDQVINGNQGSYTLGSTPVNALEMSNALATIANQGKWCAPNPVESVIDRHGKEVPIERTPCEQVMTPQVADELATGMEKDTINGTAATTAKSEGWSRPMSAKTGTTDSSMSNSFAGFTRGANSTAGFVYTFSDKNSSPLCWTGGMTVACADGNSFGANGPGTTFFRAAKAMGKQ